MGLLGAILVTLKKMYCKCGVKNIGEETNLPIPFNYPLLQDKMKTLEWINTALKKMDTISEGNSVVKATVTPFGPSAGYYSELAKLAVEYSDKNDPKNPPTDCIVKFLPMSGWRAGKAGFDKRFVFDLLHLGRTECQM
jgi:hypothetical protein